MKKEIYLSFSDNFLAIIIQFEVKFSNFFLDNISKALFLEGPKIFLIKIKY